MAALLFGFLVGLSVALMIFVMLHIRNIERENNDLRNDIASLIKDNDKLINRVQELENTQAKRLPHDSAAAIEDTIASLLNAKRIHDALKSDTDALEYWLDKAGEFGRGARGGNGYDPDEPTGTEARRS